MYEYDFHTYSVRRRRPKKKIVRNLVILFAFSLVGFTIVSFFSQGKIPAEKKVVNPLGSEVLALIDTVTNNKQDELGQIVQKSLHNAPGAYGISINHLTIEERYVFNEHRIFEAASLYKLWVMATAFEQIEKGILREDDTLHGDIATINTKFGIATEAAEFTEGEFNFTVAQALQQMITISHNYAALLLTEKIKLSQITAFLAKHGLQESAVGGKATRPTTTAYDTALFFEKLTKGELANEAHTQKMLELLQAQRLNQKLPKYLPINTVVAHKTGELGLLTHDAGVVYTPKGEYIIVVLSQTPYPPEAQERIATFSKAVYEYMLAE